MPYNSADAQHDYGAAEAGSWEQQGDPSRSVPYHSADAQHDYRAAEAGSWEQQGDPSRSVPYNSADAQHDSRVAEAGSWEQHGDPSRSVPYNSADVQHDYRAAEAGSWEQQGDPSRSVPYNSADARAAEAGRWESLQPGREQQNGAWSGRTYAVNGGEGTRDPATVVLDPSHSFDLQGISFAEYLARRQQSGPSGDVSSSQADQDPLQQGGATRDPSLMVQDPSVSMGTSLPARLAKYLARQAWRRFRPRYRYRSTSNGGTTYRMRTWTELSTQLPSGWERFTDLSNGMPYYGNIVTGETSWSPPDGATVIDAEAETGGQRLLLPAGFTSASRGAHWQKDGASSPAEPGWQQQNHDWSGQTYAVYGGEDTRDPATVVHDPSDSFNPQGPSF